MRLKKSIVVILLFFIICSVYAGSIDLIVMIDTSSSMEPYFDDLLKYVFTLVLKQNLENGDQFHLLSFSSLPIFELSESISGDEKTTAILKRISHLKGKLLFGKYTDLLMALDFLLEYAINIPTNNPKRILLLSDGIHDPPPGSPYANLTIGEVRKELARYADRIIDQDGWSIHLLKISPETKNITDVSSDPGRIVSEPAGKSTPSAGKTPLPGDDAKVPGDDSKVPGDDSKVPGDDSKVPGEDSKVPGEDSKVPGEDSKVPGEDSKVPGDDAKVPGDDSKVPGEDSKVPGDDAKVPGDDAKVPGDDTKVPGEDSKVPGDDAKVPGDDAKVPGDDAKVPGDDAKVPGDDAKVPGDDTKVPGDDTKVPGDDSKVPGDDAKVPGDDAKVPGDDAKVPGDDSKVPGDDAKVPGDDAKVPGDDAKVPGDDSKVPGDDSKVPGDDAKVPGDDTKVPGDDAKVPGDDAKVPGENHLTPTGPINIFKEISDLMDLDLNEFNEEAMENLPNISVGFPKLYFPEKELGEKRQTFSVPFYVENFQKTPVTIALNHIEDDNGNILTDKIHTKKIPANRKVKLIVSITLKDTYSFGPTKLNLKLFFDDENRISPREGAISFIYIPGYMAQFSGWVMENWFFIVLVFVGLVFVAFLILVLRKHFFDISLSDYLKPPGWSPRHISYKDMKNMIEMRVSMQNPNIGFRNVHKVEEKGNFNVGGRNSSFLIFLVPFPANIARIRKIDGEYVFTPRKPEFFPEQKTPLYACLDKKIKLVSSKGYEITITFTRYISRLETINNLLHSIKRDEE